MNLNPSSLATARFSCTATITTTCVQIEDDSEIRDAEREMDEVDRALHQSPRKQTIRRRHSTVGTRLIKMLSKYKMKLEFRCNGITTVWYIAM